MNKASNRRSFIQNSAFLAGLPLIMPNYLISDPLLTQKSNVVSPSFPSQDKESVREVVGASHANFDRVKELVNERPALAKAAHDWGYGDWESALGAASHMGRKDIAEFLIDNGARPNIYTLAMLGKYEAVKAIIESSPGIQKINGPHGITLLQHAKSQLFRKDIDPTDKINVEAMVAYLEELGDAGIAAPSIDMSEEEKELYIGKYVFGDGERDYFIAKINNRGMLALARGEGFGRSLLKQSEHVFAPGGSPAVRIIFDVIDDKIISVTIHDPLPVLKAMKT